MMARQTKEQMRRFRALTEAQAVLGWGVILVLAALVGTIYVNQASRIATIGRRVQVMQAELSHLKRENAAMERQIAQVQRLERLQAEAARLGFVPAAPGDIEYVIIPDYPAEPQPFLLEPQPTPRPLPLPPQTLDEALWLTFRGRIGDFVEGKANE